MAPAFVEMVECSVYSEETQFWFVCTYPGALFQVPVVVVGQKHGIVPGVIRATLLWNTSAVLDELQESQYAGKSCTTLNYTVFSLQTIETILLEPEGLREVPLNYLEVRVTLLPCPRGFTLTGLPPKCNCADELQKHHIYNCHITNQTIICPSPLWIGYQAIKTVRICSRIPLPFTGKKIARLM